MAKRPNLGQIASSAFSVGHLNSAFEKIDTAFDNTLSRDGSTPNTMLSDLDMNSSSILNADGIQGTSITVDNATIGGKLFSGTIEWRSDWLTATAYQKLDVTRYGGDLYVCLIAHTSGVFMTDYTDLKWELFIENTVGPTGEGVPSGGTTNQVLTKVDGTDYNTQWSTPSGLSDGDKGDITVSTGGTAWAIDAGAVTLSKMANLAASTILGNNTGSPATPIALTATQVRTLINVADGATANSSDATLLARANHTGTQAASTISDFSSAADARIAAASINALSDVIVTTPSTGQVIKYNGTNWVNDTDATGGGGVSDGDKGDITVSGGGTVWTIDNSAVTLAKQADMATASVVYRKTAGAGAPEVQTLATLKTDLGLTGTNSGDQTSIVGITGTKAQFNTAVTDGDILYVGDVTTNATHTGDVTGSGALTIDPTAISGKTLATIVGADHLLFFDATDSLLKKGLASDLIGVAGATNLSYTAATRVLASDTGTDATLPLVVAAGDAGLMTGADKTILDTLNAAYVFGQLTANYTLTSSTAVQKLFNWSTNGAVTLSTGRYRFSCMVYITSMSATSGNAAFSLAGTATLADQIMHVIGIDSAAPLAAVAQTGSATVTSATVASMVRADNGTGMVVTIEGMFNVTVTGTVIPSVQLVTAAAAIVQAGSFFECERIADTGSNTRGTWS